MTAARVATGAPPRLLDIRVERARATWDPKKGLQVELVLQNRTGRDLLLYRRVAGPHVYAFPLYWRDPTRLTLSWIPDTPWAESPFAESDYTAHDRWSAGETWEWHDTIRPYDVVSDSTSGKNLAANPPVLFQIGVRSGAYLAYWDRVPIGIKAVRPRGYGVDNTVVLRFLSENW